MTGRAHLPERGVRTGHADGSGRPAGAHLPERGVRTGHPEPSGSAAGGQPGTAPVARVVAVFLVPYLLLGLFWVFANPAMAAPDENAHLVKALGMARLDIGVPAPPAPAGTTDLGQVRNASISRIVEIPARLNPAGYECFAFRPQTTAACQAHNRPQAAGEVPAGTTLGAYPPFLYPPVGLVAGLGSDPTSAVVLGRLVVLAVSLAVLGATAAHLVRWLGARSLVGVAVLLTPMAIFSLGILNTSSVEILGATAMASVVACYARRPESLAAAGTQVLILVGGSALVLSRQLGLVTMATLTLLLFALGGWREVWAGLRTGRPVTWAAVLGPAAATLAVAGWELRYDHPALLGPWLSADSLGGFAAQLMQLAQEAVGWFGWLEVRPPLAVNLVWLAAGAALVATALLLGDRRDRTVLVAVLAVALLVSYVTYARVFFPVDAGIQGRHVLPILAVVAVWSGVVVAQRVGVAALRVPVAVGAVLLSLVVAVGLYLNCMRYAVGLGPGSGALWFVPAAQWAPPLGWYPWLALGLAGCGALGATWLRLLRAT